jgi:hypothetical protein
MTYSANHSHLDKCKKKKVKYRFQNPSPTARYHSTFHALTTITREERLHGLYKGISSPLVRRARPPTVALPPCPPSPVRPSDVAN